MEAIKNAEFFELRRLVIEAGLFQPSRVLSVVHSGSLFLLFAASVTILMLAGRFWVHLMNAVFLAFVFGQLGFLMHDIGHGQVVGLRFRRGVPVCLNLLLGWSTAWWVAKHSAHHATPNLPGSDPDIAVGFVAFSKKQAEDKRGWYRFIARHQHFFFPALLFFEAWHLRAAAVRYLRKQRTAQAKTDLFLMAVHGALYFGALFFFLPVPYALAFALAHNGLLGFYLGMAFAPNHLGMPLVKPGEALDYLRAQVITARNISGGWWVTVLFGGLNFQIEHHLFSGMPRRRLRQAACIVEKFCQERDIGYHSVSPWVACKEVFVYLRAVARCVA